MNYIEFLEQLDLRLEAYFNLHKEYVLCKKGCSLCCECGDYPISQIEFEYLMKGYIELDDASKQIVRQNINDIKKGEICPFLFDNKCLVYEYRPVICRVHGLAYMGVNSVIVPYCAENGLNYSTVYNDKTLCVNPVPVNLDTPSLLQGIEYGEIRTMFDWFKNNMTEE